MKQHAIHSPSADALSPSLVQGVWYCRVHSSRKKIKTLVGGAVDAVGLVQAMNADWQTPLGRSIHITILLMREQHIYQFRLYLYQPCLFG